MINITPVNPAHTYKQLGKSPLTVIFKDKITRSPTLWSWNFGDKSTSTGRQLD